MVQITEGVPSEGRRGACGASRVEAAREAQTTRCTRPAPAKVLAPLLLLALVLALALALAPCLAQQQQQLLLLLLPLPPLLLPLMLRAA
jgi:hypothetical protein